MTDRNLERITYRGRDQPGMPSVRLLALRRCSPMCYAPPTAWRSLTAACSPFKGVRRHVPVEDYGVKERTRHKTLRLSAEEFMGPFLCTCSPLAIVSATTSCSPTALTPPIWHWRALLNDGAAHNAHAEPADTVTAPTWFVCRHASPRFSSSRRSREDGRFAQVAEVCIHIAIPFARSDWEGGVVN